MTERTPAQALKDALVADAEKRRAEKQAVAVMEAKSPTVYASKHAPGRTPPAPGKAKAKRKAARKASRR